MLPVFYQPNLSGTEITLSEDESKHCVRVLRMQEGDFLYLADGLGNRAKAHITDTNPKKCVLEITHSEQLPKTFPYELTIALAPTKNMERIEWFIEKAVECGISNIAFIETTNGERAKINMERCHKIAVSAMKQSKQWHLPTIQPIIKLNDFVITQAAETKLIAWCETDKTAFIQPYVKGSSICILVGPEGDFTAQETELAKANGFIPVSLGQSILRTETAALFACMSVKTLMS